MNTACPRSGLPDYRRRTSGHSVSNHLRVVRGSPGCQRVLPAVTGFVLQQQTRPLTPTESSSPVSVCRDLVTDWSFSFRCSPPRIAATQLRFDTARFFTAQERTLTAPSSCLLRRTAAGILPADLTLLKRGAMPEGFCTFRTADPLIIQFDLPAGWSDAGLAKKHLVARP